MSLSTRSWLVISCTTSARDVVKYAGHHERPSGTCHESRPGPFCFTSTEARLLIRDGYRGVKGARE